MEGNIKFKGGWATGEWRKALVIVSTIILFLSLSFLFYGVSQHNQTIDLLISKTEEDINHTVNQIRNRSFVFYEKKSQAFLQINTDIVQAFAERDRERLYELTLSRFDILKKENRYFSNLHFHLPDGHSFLRMHDPEHWGDYLAAIRPSLKKIHKEKKMMSGFEIGLHGAFFRIFSPVFYQGNYVGALEFGLNINHAVDIVQGMLHLQATTYIAEEEWKKAHAADKVLMVQRDHFLISSLGDPIYGKLPLDLPMGVESHVPVELDGKYYIVHIHPAFKDFNDTFVGGLLILQDITQLIENKRKFLPKTILFTICLLFFGFIALYVSFNKLLGNMSREMTKREEAENLYKEAKTLLECMIDSVPDLIYYKDRSGVYLGCNKAFADLTGHDQDAIVGRTDSELFHPELVDFFTVHDQEIIHSGSPYTHECWLELKDTPLYMHTHKTPYRGPDESLIGVIGISRNLTVYKRAAEALEQAAWEWAAAMDAEGDAVYILDLERRLIQGNKAFYKMVGADADAVLGHHIEAIVHPEGEAEPCPVCRAQKEMKDAHIILETSHPDNPSGVPLEITVTIVRDSEKKPLSIFMRLHDLSEQREVENRLRQSKDEWERTFDAISDLITIQDFDMRIIRANKAAEDFFGVERGGLAGKYCHEVFRGQDSPCQGCPMLAAPGQTGDYPPIISHENLQKTFHVSSSPLYTADGKVEYLVHIARDVTAQKQLEEELFQVHKMEAIGTLAGGIAHDFNNILGVIVGFSEFVRDDLAEDNPSREDMDQVLQAAYRARDLVKQILSFSRKSEHQLQLVDPYSIVREVVKMLHATLPTTVTIEERLNKDVGLIEADPTKIHQILINLCTNAFQAMEGEKGVLRIGLQRMVVQEEVISRGDVLPGNYIVFQISDTGQGMSKEIRDRIFDPFFSTKAVGKGTGLGLAVLHGIVHDYKGFVEVESVLGAGSTFRVYLPAIEDFDGNPAVEDTTAARAEMGGSEKILIVDDDPLLAKVYGRILGDLGYGVTEVTSSREALKMVGNDPGRFDLLLTDQTMPDLTGAELAAEVMKIDASIPVIMCTGHSSVVSEEDALAMGIRRYIFKPVKGPELVAVVREVLDERKNPVLS